MSIFTSFKLPTTITPNSTPSADWQDPSNILLVDDLFAVASGPANILEVGTFNLNVPFAATVLGITLQLKGKRGVNPVNLSIYAVDDITGVAYAYPLTPDFSGFDGTNTLYTLTATLFGTTWDSNQINNIKFRLIADNPLYLDAILASVEYVPAVVPPPIPTPAAGIVVDEFVEAQPFNFAQALSAIDLFLFLETFTTPLGVLIQYADFHTTSEAYMVLNQGIPFKEEVVRITNVEQNYGGSGLCRISFGTLANRGLNFIWPYTSDSSRILTHDSTSQAVLSNPAVFYDRFLKKNQIDALVSAPIEVLEDDVQVLYPTTKFNFKGSGVTVIENISDDHMVDIQIDGNSPQPPEIVDVGSGTSGTTQVASLSFFLTAAGINRAALVQIETQQNVTVTSVTFNGTPLTQKVTKTDAGHNLRTEQWLLVAPALGSHNVVITLSAPAYISAGAVSLQGVNQSIPTGATAVGNATSTTPTVTDVTTASYSLVFDSFCVAPGVPSTFFPGAGQALLWSFSAGADIRQGAASYLPAGLAPDNVTNHYTINPSTSWVMSSIEILGIQPIISPLEVQDEGVPVDSSVIVINFVGAGVTASQTGPGEVEVNIPGGGGGQAAIQFEDEGVNLGTPGTVDEVDFVGSGVVATRIGNKVTVTISGGGGGSGEVVEKDFNQVAHGFTQDQILKSSGTNGEFDLAQSDTPANADVIGMVVDVIDADNFTLATEGYVTMNALPGGAVAGDNLWLDPVTPGALTLTEPTSPGEVSQPLARVIDASTKEIYLHNWRGQEQQAIPIMGGSFSVNADKDVTGWSTSYLTPGGSGWSGGIPLANGIRLANALTLTTSPIVGWNFNGVATYIFSSASFNNNNGKRIIIKGEFATKGLVCFAFSDINTGGEVFSQTATTASRVQFLMDASNVYTITSDSVGITKKTVVGATVGLDNPHLYTIVWTMGTKVEFYIDGLLVETHTSGENIIGNGNGVNIYIGSSGGATNCNVTGLAIAVEQ